jgi:hypothetical protein
MAPKRAPHQTGRPKRKGRPPGSVGLTAETARRIVELTRAGAYPWVAAEIAGVNPRTFREWMARGEGTHPTRPGTPKLRRFYREVTQAHAEVRASAEIRVLQEDPKHWLSRVARSRPDREGWSDPARDPDPSAPSGPTIEERIRERELRNREEAAAARRAEPSGPTTSNKGSDVR